MKRRFANYLSCLMLVAFVWACVVWRTSYRAGASKVPSTFAMQTSLARTLPALAFDAVGLDDVLGFYRDVTGSNVVIDWPDLERAKIDRNEPVSARLKNVTAGEALTTILSNVKADFQTQEGIILIHPAGQPPRAWSVWRGHTSHAAATGSSPAFCGLDDSQAPASFESNIPSVEIAQMPFGDVLDYFRRTQSMPIKVDWGSLRAAGVTPRTPVTFQSRNLTYAFNLSLILAQVTDKAPIQFEVRDNGIYIATQTEFDRREGPPAPWWRSLGPATIAILSSIASLLLLYLHLRMIRWSAVITPLVAVGVVAFLTWRHGPPSWEFVHRATRYTLTADRGAIHFYKTPADPATPYHVASNSAAAMSPAKLIVRGRAGFYLRHQGWPAESLNLEAPLWSLVVSASLVPLAWLITTLKRRKLHQEGKCPHCGYDLRASTDRCPECGSPIASVASATQM